MNTFTPQTHATTMELSPSAFGAIHDHEVPDATTPLQRLGDVLRRRWLLLLGCSLIATLLAGTIGLSLPPVYTARAQVVVTPPAPPANGTVAPRPDETALTIETEVSAMSSRDQINRVLDHLVMKEDFPIASFAKDGRLAALERSVVSRLLGGFAGGWIESLLTPEQSARLHAFAEPPTPQRRREQILDELERNLKINSEPRSRVISVRYTASSAEIAASVANAAIETYIGDQEDRKRDSIRRDLDRLDRQLPELRKEVETANAVIRAYRLDHAVLDSASTEQQEQQAVVLKSKINATRIALTANEAERAALAGQGAGPRNDLADARLKEEAAQLTDRARAFQQQLDALGAGLRDLQPAADHLKQLVRLADAKRRIYEDELLLQQTLARNQDLVLPDSAMLSAAAPPQKPASTNPLLFLPPAFVLGLLVAGFAAVWHDGRDTTLRSERTIPGTLGIPYGGFLLRARPPLDPSASNLHAAAVRSLFAATLSLEAARHGRKIVLVTSSVSGEATQDLATDFSLYAAQLLPRVLLINLNFRDPVARPGLSAQIRGRPLLPEHPLEGMVITRPVPTLPLDVLSLGYPHRDPVAFLVGHDLRQTFRQLRERYDCIVVHAGPILETAEAPLLAAEADCILLAVRWGRTPRRLVGNALSILKRSEGPLLKPGRIKAVLTQVRVRQHLAYRFGDAIDAMAKSYRRRRFT